MAHTIDFFKNDVNRLTKERKEETKFSPFTREIFHKCSKKENYTAGKGCKIELFDRLDLLSTKEYDSRTDTYSFPNARAVVEKNIKEIREIAEKHNMDVSIEQGTLCSGDYYPSKVTEVDTCLYIKPHDQ